ncbi:MAG: histidine ammonia-lyase [Bacteroidales bacterium]
MPIHYISPERLTFKIIRSLLDSGASLALSETAGQRIEKCRVYLDQRISNQQEPVYGVNTGFGSLCNHIISPQDLHALQKNLVMSHACGVGEEVPPDIVRLMLLLKIQSLSYGHSAIALKTVERLIDFYNNDILPVVYTQGSLGASGDLAPLAHLSLPLLGMGEVYYQEKRMQAAEVLQQKGWQPLELESKEGLALLNGTQFMAAYGTWCLLKASQLSRWADLTGALSLEAYDGRIEPFFEQVHLVRHHKGQIETAARIRGILEGSELIQRSKKHVQDPYSFRCMPQVHGATKDVLHYAEGVLENEINAVTDNPTVFPDDDLIISAGNFHGQPLALTMDFLAIAMAELANISERRIYRLISGTRNLPAFLIANPGLNSGFMIPQYTAASVVSQNKQLCTPASVDSIESSQGQEDHVSMGANAAVKLRQVVLNVQRVIGIELFNASQAMFFRQEGNTSAVLSSLLKDFRSQVDFIENDTLMYLEMKKAIDFIEHHDVEDYVNF